MVDWIGPGRHILIHYIVIASKLSSILLSFRFQRAKEASNKVLHKDGGSGESWQAQDTRRNLALRIPTPAFLSEILFKL